MDNILKRGSDCGIDSSLSIKDYATFIGKNLFNYKFDKEDLEKTLKKEEAIFGRQPCNGDLEVESHFNYDSLFLLHATTISRILLGSSFKNKTWVKNIPQTIKYIQYLKFVEDQHWENLDLEDIFEILIYLINGTTHNYNKDLLLFSFVNHLDYYLPIIYRLFSLTPSGAL